MSKQTTAKPPSIFQRDFSLVVTGQIISMFGATILKFALSLYVLDQTGRADIFATILAVSTLPVIFLSPIGGAIADRFNRRNLMVIFDFCSSATVLIFLLFLQNGSSSVLLVGIVMTILSVISTMYQPTVQSSIPALVHEEGLMQANGIVSGIGALTGIAGPILGGVLYGMIGLKAIVLVSCISFFLSAVMEIFIRIPFKKREQAGNMAKTIFGDIKDGLRYIVKENPFVLKVMLLGSLINMVLIPIFLVGIPYIVKITMNGSDTAFGFAQGVISFSSILGAIAIGIVGKKFKVEKTWLLLAFSGLMLVPMGISVFPTVLGWGFIASFSIFVGCAFFILLLATILSIYFVTIIQKTTRNEMLGKTMAILFAASSCATPIGQMVYGALLDGFSSNVYVPFFIGAAVTVAVSLLAQQMLKTKA